MKERADRWKRFMSQPVTSSFKHLHRFNAVNGKALNYRRDKRISIRTKLNITRNYRRSHYEIATLGAVGSSLSHIGIWKRFVASGASVCLVLEDDAILTDTQLRLVNELTPPEGWGIWLLGCYLPNLIVHPLQKGWARVYNFTAAHAYLITRAAALKLLEEPHPIETHIEYYMTGTAYLKDIKIVNNDNVHVEFFRNPEGPASSDLGRQGPASSDLGRQGPASSDLGRQGPRTADSNTSQHKKSGCPTCNVQDDYKQLYRGFTRRSKRGMKIIGMVEAPQPKKILNFNNTAERENFMHP